MKPKKSGRACLSLVVALTAACGGSHGKTDAASGDSGGNQGDSPAEARQPDVGPGTDNFDSDRDAGQTPSDSGGNQSDSPAEARQPDAGPGTDDFDADGDAGQVPIVGRPVAGPFVCSVTRERTSHLAQAWFAQSSLQPLADGSLTLARVQKNASDPWDGPRSFLVSSFALDGSLGPSTTLPVKDASAVMGLATAPQGQGFALVWADAQGLHFATFDAQGALLAAPRLVTVLDADSVMTLQMAADRSGLGFAVALSTHKALVNQPYALFLDSQGILRGPPRRLGTPPSDARSTSYPAPTVTAASDGYAFVWNDVDGKSSRMFFAKADALGNETVAPRLIAISTDDSLSFEPGGFERSGARIIEAGGGFVAAWTEGYAGFVDGPPPFANKGAWSVVRLTRLDALGKPTGTSATMRAPQVDVDEVEPVLTPFADTLAVSWGRGSHIYQCGGCVPDHRIDLVLIDPVTLSPLSNVATVSNGGALRAGGLLRKQVAVSGSSILVLYSLTFHTSTEPGSAVFTCRR